MGLVLLRIPFFFNGHLQTDAFISWRCAKNIVETGVYGYNPGEASSASTSHLYVFLCAGLFKLFGAYFFVAQLVMSAGFMLAGLGLLARVFFEDPKKQRAVWALSALMPVSFQASTMGMETALLILLIAMTVWFSARAGAWGWLALGAAFLLPWARPDAVVYGGLVFLWLWVRDKKFPFVFGSALLAGTCSMLAFNHAYFGQWLHQTIVGKSLCHHPSHTLGAIAESVREVFAGKNAFNPGIFSPFFTRFLVPVREIVLVSVLAIFSLAWFRFRTKATRAAVLIFILLALVPPAVYALGGIVYFWYLLPSANFANVLLFSWFVDRWQGKGLRLVLILVAVLACLQWAQAFKEGGNERQMKDIGLDIAKLARTGDTLYLEPAGAPVFYSNLYTWDSFGITSPLITDYEKQHGKNWLMAFLKDKHPDLIFRVRPFSLATCGADLDEVWFNKHYKIKKEWVYDPAMYYSKNAPTWRLVKDRAPLAYVLYGRT